MSVTIRGGAVLCADGLHEGYGLRIENGVIARIAPNLQLPEDANEIDARDQIILPGFVNGHNHMYGVLSHGITAEAMVTEFSSFLEDFWWPYVENRIDKKLAALTAKWACVEMIESGVTSFVDILEAPNALMGALDAEAEVVREAGLRAYLSFEACERMGKESGQAGLRENCDFIQKHQNDPLIKGILSIHTLFTCPKDYVKQARAMAKDCGAKFHMHLSESVYEPNWCKVCYGQKPVDVYEELNCLDGDVLASQLVQIDEKEINTFAKSGASAVSMPLSNCEVGGGIAPVTELLDAGVQVGLGSDGYVNNFFEVMRGAFLIHKANRQDPQAMGAKRVYDMATRMGAAALGRSDLGVLAEGNAADVITVRMDTPTPINAYNVYDQLILFRNPADVVNVFVDGKALKREGNLTTLDKEAIRRELSCACEKFWNV